IEEILKQIPNQCDRLILIPHRFLHLFPLHALPVSAQTWQHFHPEANKDQNLPSPSGRGAGGEGKFLLDLFPQGVSYAPSCQLLQQAQNRQRPDFNHLFAIQNPTNDLLFTDLEVQAISQHFHPQDILVQGEAKKSRIDDRRLQAAHCAHFSCHGYFNFAQPLLSALLLADSELTPPLPPEDPDRYLSLRNGNAIDLSQCLTLADIFALDFRSCRLVVLSACETGISDFQSVSDEYISLPSGFLVAGSSSVVPTLWAVNDLSTSFLMIKFYQLLKAGLSVSIALNSAQRWLRDITIGELQDLTDTLPLPRPQRESVWDILNGIGSSETKPFQSPYHWAAFCAVGQ
ncbi:MAG: CHAT domain-containing protein, partial [Coleofasciculaceae cyanobacterium SM2_1_6]|nr:CHAT domain-containing protein [Coleofasciculaceae cyanobacterium SM2_1_6]